MRKINVLALFSAICLISCTTEKMVELPLSKETGYGPFIAALGGISPNAERENNPWKKTYLDATGLPAGWSDVKTGAIETNMHQAVYQNYLLGNISEEFYSKLQKSWNWVPDTLNMSKELLKCSIAFAFGKDSTGEIKMVVDANNNLDLSDDKIFEPVEMNPSATENRDSLSRLNSFNVTYERFVNNKIEKVSSPIFIAYMSQFNLFMCNFAEYAVAELDGEKIAVCSDNFTNLSYSNPEIVLLSDSLNNGSKAGGENIVLKNEYIEVKGNLYKNLGVNLNKNVLVLEKTNSPKSALNSTQVGYKAFPFTGTDFTAKSPVSSEGLKGKYVLLDFWAVWCGPCRQELPNLRGLYGKVDKSKFEIVGVVGESPAETLEKIIADDSITWPQIFVDDSNTIIKEYGIHGYPTIFLLNPEGVIIAKELRGKSLEDKLKELSVLE